MAKDVMDRFEKWRARLSGSSATLVQMVLDEIVPLFEARGFRRYPDYAAGRSDAVAASTLALQRRDGPAWATVELQFNRRGQPNFAVVGTLLPDICHRIGPQGDTDIPRLQANVVEGDIYLMLCKGRAKGLDCNFGYQSFALFPERRLRAEIASLQAVLPLMFDLLDHGIPQAWMGRRGQVDKHFWANPGARYLHAHAA